MPKILEVQEVPDYGRGLTGLLKRGFHEVPVLMACGGIAIATVGLVCYGMYLEQWRQSYTKPYKYRYTIFRPDDPRAKQARPELYARDESIVMK